MADEKNTPFEVAAAAGADAAAGSDATASVDGAGQTGGVGGAGKAGGVTNVVFDMGGVLLAWDPMTFPAHFGATPEESRMICDALFEAPQWPLLDAGAISKETMLMCAHEALPQRLYEIADKSFEAFPYLQPVIESVNELGFRLKDAGYNLYILSNVSVRFEGEFLPRIPIGRVLSGFLASAYERRMKPDPEIFELLCERFGIKPESCLFVDDSKLNCLGATKAGMDAHWFTGDAAALEEHIRQAGAYEF